MLSNPADMSKGRRRRPGGVWRRALGLPLTVCSGVCTLCAPAWGCCFLTGRTAMPETAGGGRRPVDEADVRAIIDQLGGAPALQDGRDEFHEAVLRMNRSRAP